MSLENAADAQRGPGPWFVAGYDGACSCCGDDIVEGDEIRADGFGSYEGRECCGGDTAVGARASAPGAHEYHFDGTDDESMGF